MVSTERTEFEEDELFAGFMPNDAYDAYLVEQRAKQVGLSWDHYVVALAGVRLHADPFSKEQWEAMTLLERKHVLDAYDAAASRAMTPPAVVEAANAVRGTW